MNINKYTEKAREAVAAAIELARQANNPQVEPEHLLVALVEQAEGIVPELLRKMNVDPAAITRGARELTKKLTQAYGGSEPGMSPRFKLVTDQAEAEAGRMKDEFVSTEHLFIAVADEGGRSPSALLLAAHHQRESGSHLPGAREVRPRPDRAGAQGQARPGHRPRRGDPPRHPGPLPPHEEQPGAHRRARRRQDRHRRRTGRAHRARRRP
jgi:ATP-dependent Clp protease ATP-binding subunit ClpA